tara:strand:- start:39 stop:278 length:240 start_codon:yes stop_codon:yes gene_type:complete
MFRIEIPYKDRPKASIVVAHLEHPYGPESEPVVSIGCTLKGDINNPTWKVHIPENILSEVITSIKNVANPDWRGNPDCE